MHILLLECEIHLPAAQSLKDKRAVLKSLQHRIRTTYNVSVAEVDFQDKWQRSVLAFITVSALRDVCESTGRQVLDEVESRPGVEVLHTQQEWL